MTNLPVCRLCKCTPTVFNNIGMVECSTDNCLNIWLTPEQWQKLMYVPERFTGNLTPCEKAYNKAIDDLERGGV